MRILGSLFVAATSIAFSPMPARAQNLSVVVNPDVNSGETQLEYRASYAPGDDSEPSRFAQRFQIHHAFSDFLRLRAGVVQSRIEGDNLRISSVLVDAQTQFFEDQRDGFDGAMQLQGLVPVADGLPGRARIGWAMKWAPEKSVELRFNAFAAREVGEHARPGVLLETRAETNFRLGERARLGAQIYDAWGSAAGFGPFERQRHQAGPVLRLKLSKHVGIETSALIGLSAAAPDKEIRVFLNFSG